MKITNPEIHMRTEYRGSISWRSRNRRFHVWFSINGDYLSIEPRMHSNPIETMPGRHNEVSLRDHRLLPQIKALLTKEAVESAVAEMREREHKADEDADKARAEKLRKAIGGVPSILCKRLAQQASSETLFRLQQAILGA